MAKIYAIFRTAGDGLPRTLCDVEGDVCYGAGNDLEAVQAECDASNASAIAHGHASRYEVGMLPDGYKAASQTCCDQGSTNSKLQANFRELQTSFREYLSVHPALNIGGHDLDDISKSLANVAMAIFESSPPTA